MVKFLIFLLIMAALVGFIWHGEISNWLSAIQNKAVEQGPALINEQTGNLQNWWDQTGEAWIDNFVNQLTMAGKQKIDQWLEQQNLNQFGDDQGTVYAGDNPLFNEQTGESIDCYVHLLKKFPDLINQLNLQQYLK